MSQHARKVRGRRSGGRQSNPSERVVVADSDMTSCERVRDLFNRCRRMLRNGARHVVIDLHGVTVADTKIVACLVALHRLARSVSARLEVSLSQAIIEVARICRLERLVQELALHASGRPEGG